MNKLSVYDTIYKYCSDNLTFEPSTTHSQREFLLHIATCSLLLKGSKLISDLIFDLRKEKNNV